MQMIKTYWFTKKVSPLYFVNASQKNLLTGAESPISWRDLDLDGIKPEVTTSGGMTIATAVLDLFQVDCIACFKFKGFYGYALKNLRTGKRFFENGGLGSSDPDFMARLKAKGPQPMNRCGLNSLIEI